MMASHPPTLHLNNGQMSLFLTKSHQILAIFYILLIVVQVCQASSSNENAINKFDNIQNADYIPGNPNRVDSREVSFFFFF